MDDNFPFDRPHWTVSVSFPVEHLGRMDELSERVSALAERRGGRLTMSARPAEGFVGREGHRDFGFAVAFEAGDANAYGFMRLAARDFADLGVQVEHDPEDVTYPSEDDFAPRP